LSEAKDGNLPPVILPARQSFSVGGNKVKDLILKNCAYLRFFVSLGMTIRVCFLSLLHF